MVALFAKKTVKVMSNSIHFELVLFFPTCQVTVVSESKHMLTSTYVKEGKIDCSVQGKGNVLFCLILFFISCDFFSDNFIYWGMFMVIGDVK